MQSTGSGRAPVMADVAQAAGVSHQTVSRVLNDHPNVKPATRDRVLAAIRELGYRPNVAARALVTRRTRTLGVVSFNTTLYGPASMLYGIEQAAKDLDYFVAVAALAALDRRSVLDAVDRLRDQAVEGLIVIAPQTSAVNALSQVRSDLPLVAVGCGTHAALSSVAVDNEAGAERATSYLLDLGHRTVHHVAGPRSWLDAQEREVGWRRALSARGAAQPEPFVGGDWSSRTGYELGRELAARAHDPRDPITALFCANDHMALGLLRAVQQAGLRVPEDLSLIGFDDIPEAEYFGPPLTTIRQDFDELGRRALGTLIELVDLNAGGGPAPRNAPRVTIGPGLVVRASTAPPRAGAA
ncbi:LacI family DNA-binding transcriptional regulator [Actinospica durhamensis]|uniref:LacI family DNA-binding transcriptional regulator n=1 Tax=Actinospica durhamensis TaxID=1508375 RepID=A0A941ITI9_9ACTN|nr:LacI family DNA-binding transcriptional regulator [Actinospica durhamensis]MBR7834401.1 LacI family DNA-binding transcriptional regulator [Actinospica durhamensis]